MKTLFFTCLILLSGCANVGWEDSRISVNFHASEYNDFANRYYERPTMATIRKFPTGKEMLIVDMENYNKRYLSYSSVTFLKSNIDDYVECIDKYFAWEELALDSGDLVDKQICKVESHAFDVEFGMYSASKYGHYLTLGHIGAIEHYYDRKNAERLKDVLISFRDGSIHITNDDKYN